MKFLLSIEKCYHRYSRLIRTKNKDGNIKLILYEKYNAFRYIVLFLYGDFLNHTNAHNRKCVEIFHVNNFDLVATADALIMPKHNLRKILTYVDGEMMAFVEARTIDKISKAKTLWDIRKAMRNFNEKVRFVYASA